MSGRAPRAVEAREICGVDLVVRAGAFVFSGEWLETVRHLPETGMGYTIAAITLEDGRIFEQVVINFACLTRVRGRSDVPFRESDISGIRATHEIWNWREKP
jgi:hypothetical protein